MTNRFGFFLLDTMDGVAIKPNRYSSSVLVFWIKTDYRRMVFTGNSGCVVVFGASGRIIRDAYSERRSRATCNKKKVRREMQFVLLVYRCKALASAPKWRLHRQASFSFFATNEASLSSSRSCLCAVDGVLSFFILYTVVEFFNKKSCTDL